MTSLLGPDAPLIGAAELAFDAVLSDPGRLGANYSETLTNA
ncbi:MAG: hypothetical protein R2715_21520 [Ilumatobacteraceae bacterium]